MSKSGMIRAADAFLIHHLLNDCRDLGDDPFAWRRRLLDGLLPMVDAEYGWTGEMAGCRSLRLNDLGVVMGHQAGFSMRPIPEELLPWLIDPGNWPSQTEYHRRALEEPGICLARTDFIDHRSWRSLPDYRLVREIGDVDHRMWCFREIPRADDESLGLLAFRVIDRRDFAPRDRAVVRLIMQMLAPLADGPLARFAEPSPADLTPQVRRVLRCLLEGEGDKQIALRLGLSRHTINFHTKAIYRHFRVRGRHELMARWIRRGWSSVGPDEE